MLSKTETTPTRAKNHCTLYAQQLAIPPALHNGHGVKRVHYNALASEIEVFSIIPRARVKVSDECTRSVHYTNTHTATAITGCLCATSQRSYRQCLE